MISVVLIMNIQILKWLNIYTVKYTLKIINNIYCYYLNKAPIIFLKYLFIE